MGTKTPWNPEPWCGALTYVGLSLTTLSWVPILSGGGTKIELANMVQLIFILLLPALLINSRRSAPVHVLFSLLVAWSLVMLLALTLHDDRRAYGLVQQQMAQALFGWSLALCIANSNVSVSRAALVGAVVLYAALEFSAFTAGGSILLGAIEFLTSLNRNEFVYRVVRPAFNAFTYEVDAVYLASQANNFANSLVLLACVAFFKVEENRRFRFPLSSLVATLALILAFIFFSTSAVMVIVVFVLASLVQTTFRLPVLVRPLLLILVFLLAVALFKPVSAFFTVNVEEDESSRAARVEQFQFALEAINSNVLTGAGFFEVGGSVIHNWMLFSWSTSGIVALLLVLAVYLSVLLTSLLLVRAVPRATATVLALLFVFLIRTSVGGAGGIPSGPTILSAALLTGLLVRHGSVLQKSGRTSRVAGRASRLGLSKPAPPTYRTTN